MISIIYMQFNDIFVALLMRKMPRTWKMKTTTTLSSVSVWLYTTITTFGIRYNRFGNDWNLQSNEMRRLFLQTLSWLNSTVNARTNRYYKILTIPLCSSSSRKATESIKLNFILFALRILIPRPLKQFEREKKWISVSKQRRTEKNRSTTQVPLHYISPLTFLI